MKLIYYSLGSLVVETRAINFGITQEFYWKDNKSPQGFGPFNSFFSCMKHYSYVETKFKSETITSPENVIMVDFKLKRRVL